MKDKLTGQVFIVSTIGIIVLILAAVWSIANIVGFITPVNSQLALIVIGFIIFGLLIEMAEKGMSYYNKVKN